MQSAALQVAAPPSAEPPHEKYAGDASCQTCHQEQGTSYVHTADHLTSQPGNKESILGSLYVGSNVLMIADPATASGCNFPVIKFAFRMPKNCAGSSCSRFPGTR